MNINMMVLSYVGPETLVPAASVLATIIGGLLLFGRTLLRYARKALCLVFRR